MFPKLFDSRRLFMNYPMIEKTGCVANCGRILIRAFRSNKATAPGKQMILQKSGALLKRLSLLLAMTVVCLAAPATANAGTVNGALFVDVNVDGVKQAADTGAGGLAVILKTPGGNGIVGDGDDVTRSDEHTSAL